MILPNLEKKCVRPTGKNSSDILQYLQDLGSVGAQIFINFLLFAFADINLTNTYWIIFHFFIYKNISKRSKDLFFEC